MFQDSWSILSWQSEHFCKENRRKLGLVLNFRRHFRLSSGKRLKNDKWFCVNPPKWLNNPEQQPTKTDWLFFAESTPRKENPTSSRQQLYYWSCAWVCFRFSYFSMLFISRNVRVWNSHHIFLGFIELRILNTFPLYFPSSFCPVLPTTPHA